MNSRNIRLDTANNITSPSASDTCMFLILNILHRRVWLRDNEGLNEHDGNNDEKGKQF